MKNILLVASEGLPFIKSGGLADVVASLPKALNKEGVKTVVVLPLYKKISMEHPELDYIVDYPVRSGIIEVTAKLYHTVVDEVEYYFIGEDSYFYRDGMYGYADDGERFAFYCKAVLEMLAYIDFKPDVIHSNDWHTGLIPIMAKQYEEYQEIKHVYTIHNLAFQGNFSKEVMNCLDIPDYYYLNGDLRFDGDGISFMKAGILYADEVTTVSQTYAKEIVTSEYGERMDKVLASRSDNLVGIVNGIDTELWDPATDELLWANYHAKKLSPKKECKKSLQYQLGLRVADDVCLIGIVSRMSWQKGIHLVIEKMQAIMNQDVQLVILGEGENYIESELRKIEGTYPHRAVYYCGYNEELSHKIYAGCDIFLMPSLFEPCGISQLIAMRYGTLPVVRETGGLKDTVTPYNRFDGTGNGFSFRYFTGDDMINTLCYAIETYYSDKPAWKKLMVAAMKKDVSWDNSAKQYIELYESL